MPGPSSERAKVNDWFHQPVSVRLPYIMDMMRDLSRETEPGGAVKLYAERIGRVLNADLRISLSGAGLEKPKVRITQSPAFGKIIDPWAVREQLPVVDGGLLSGLLYGEQAVVNNDFHPDPNDPAYEHLKDIRSFAAIPLFDGGVATHMVIIARHDADAFADDFLPEHVWLSNLFGRATSNLVTRKELERTHDRLKRELQTVADMQRSLLPVELPKSENLDVAAYYQTSELAGGDFYDFFELPEGKLGILIADVSGHGTAAAVIMAITHAIGHTRPGHPAPPGEMLSFINRHLCARYTLGTGTFVTAFYGIYDREKRELVFSCAGHNPPRIKRGKGGPNGIIEAAPALPLGIDADEPYHDAVQVFHPGDTLILYTDGITEARAPDGELFGTDRLDAAVACRCMSAQDLVDNIVADVNAFCVGQPAQDDRTLLVMRV